MSTVPPPIAPRKSVPNSTFGCVMSFPPKWQTPEFGLGGLLGLNQISLACCADV